MASDDHPDDDTRNFLGDLADSLCSTLGDNGGDVLVHVRPSAGGADVGIVPLDGRPPAEVLLGAVAPEDWSALGIASRGWVRTLDGSGGLTDRHGARARRVRAEVVVLVHRSGEIVGRLRLGDRVLHDQPAHGLTLDGLQRALGLPTAPPLVPTSHLFASTWLENVLRASTEEAQALSWAAVCAQHPAALLLGVEHPVNGATELVGAARALDRKCDWERLRWLVVEGSWREPNVTPSEAAWFDAGAFSRWALAERIAVRVLLRDVRRVAGPGTARRCAAILRQLGIPGRGGNATAA